MLMQPLLYFFLAQGYFIEGCNMRSNADITVVRLFTDGTCKQWYIRGVNWQPQNKVVIVNKTIVSQDVVMVYISRQSITEKMERIKVRDYLVQGIRNYGDKTGKTLRKALDTDEAVIVEAVKDYEDLGRCLAHIEVRCV